MPESVLVILKKNPSIKRMRISIRVIIGFLYFVQNQTQYIEEMKIVNDHSIMDTVFIIKFRELMTRTTNIRKRTFFCLMPQYHIVAIENKANNKPNLTPNVTKLFTSKWNMEYAYERR
jgi:hypothetical protein